MKTLTNTLYTSSRACSLWMNITFALLVVLLLIPTIASSQSPLFYRSYFPYTGDTWTEGRCIINFDDGSVNRFLSVGKFSQQYYSGSGLALWTGTDGSVPYGAWKASRTYNRTGYQDYSDFELNFIEQYSVSGSYNTNPSYFPSYVGFPATGTKFYENNSVIYSDTWTTIIDPSTRNSVWDHVLTNVNGDISVGVGVLLDAATGDESFFVLSNISNTVDSRLQRFGVTRYKWVGGDYGHVVDWSYEYSLGGYLLRPVGIVQASTNDLIVVGNIQDTSGGASRIFTIALDHTGGGMLTMLQAHGGSEEYDVLFANSVTGPHPPNNTLLIAGKAQVHNESNIYPMIAQLDYTGDWQGYSVYKYKFSAFENVYQNGQFNCAKQFQQKDAEENGNNVYRITAVGDVGYNNTWPGVSGAFIMNTASLTSTPSWAKIQKDDFHGGTTTQTTAKWFVAQEKEPVGINPPEPLLGEYVYIGTQNSDGVFTDAVSGGLQKTTGTSSACTYTPTYVSLHEASQSEEEYEVSLTSWGTDDEQRTATTTKTQVPYFCDHSSQYQSFTINYGKRSINTPEKSTLNELAEIQQYHDELIIYYTSEDEHSISLVVTDVLGNQLVNQKVACKAGHLSFALNTNGWVSGAYFVSVITPSTRYNKNIAILK